MESNSYVVTGRVLVVDDHAAARESMAEVLRQAGHEVEACASAAEALRRVEKRPHDVVVTDLQMPGMSGLELVRALAARAGDLQMVMVTAHATIPSAVEAMRHGVFDYIEKPFNADQLEQVVERALRQNAATLAPAASVGDLAQDAEPLIGSSDVMRALRQRIRQVAATNETVLITGESGVGKELVARAIHAHSRRAAQALVSLNCPALSAQLLESELFGHERGAFTGADAARIGRFELADGGTLLLDEVTELELGLQAKLLRVLQERAFERVGSSQTKSVDVRLLAATNRDLRNEVTTRRFREDLYFRLAVLPLAIPALRERRGDVMELVEHFLVQTAGRLGRERCELAACARDLLEHYHWPGNVRELQNLVTRACVLNAGAPITADELRPWLLASDTKSVAIANANTMAATPDLPVGTSLHETERRLIESTLEHFGGRRADTAKALGIGVRTLTNKLRSYGYAPRAKTFGRAA